MGFSPVPHYAFREIIDISPDFLKGLGIEFLMLDLDNTAASYGEHTPSDSVTRWVSSMKDCGVEMCIVSNSVRETRVDMFADTLGIKFIKGASKPSPKGILKAMEAAGFCPCVSAFVGDQVYTDALAANRAGIVSIVVRPRQFTNPFLALRYAAEAPFRAISKRKMRKNQNSSLARQCCTNAARLPLRSVIKKKKDLRYE